MLPLSSLSNSPRISFSLNVLLELSGGTCNTGSSSFNFSCSCLLRSSSVFLAYSAACFARISSSSRFCSSRILFSSSRFLSSSLILSSSYFFFASSAFFNRSISSFLFRSSSSRFICSSSRFFLSFSSRSLYSRSSTSLS
jgi:hypothetical protein